MSKLARLIAQYEGFGVPAALPTRNDNPGDLRHAPGEMHAPDDPNGVGSFESIEAGWAALERQLQLYADRHMSLRAAIYAYAPPADGNDAERYLDVVCAGLNCSPDTLVSEALKQP